MKKLLVTMAVAITGVVQALALTPSGIRENARFLTDRMAYELNLTPMQYEDCYEINYDFIYAINPIMDEVVYGYPEAIDIYYNYLDYRNEDLRWIMNEAQYMAFMSLDYFFRPIYTYAGNWLFRVFQIYTNTRYFYYDPPRIYHSYAGAHGRHYFPHGFYGGSRYGHRIYGHARPIDRVGGRHDFAPYSGHRRGYYDRNHDRHYGNPGRPNNGNRHYRRDNYGNNNGGGNNGGINHRDGNNSNGNRGNNNYGNDNRGNDNHGSGNRGNNNYGNDNRGNNNRGGGNSGNNNRGGSTRGSVIQGGGHSNINSSSSSNIRQNAQVRQQTNSSQVRQQSNVSSSRIQNSQRGGSSHSGGQRRGAHGDNEAHQGHRR